MMNNFKLIKLIPLIFAGCLSTAHAATFTVELPGNSLLYNTNVDALFDANIYVDGLPDFGGFDFNLTYNSNNLTAVSLTTASVFGAGTDTAYFIQPDPGADPVPYSITTSAGFGTVHFAEAISGTNALTAGLAISAPTLLGTVHFKALATSQNNVLNFTNPIVLNFAGDSLPGSLQAATVNIDAAPVPLPASAFMFIPGILALFRLRKQPSVLG